MPIRFLLVIPALLLSISVWTLSSLETNLNWSNWLVWSESRAVRQLIFGIISVLISVLLVYFYKIQTKFRAIIWFNIIASFINLSVIITDLEIRGASRWLRVGGFSLQPSELVKVGLVMWVAYFASFRDMKKSSELFWYWSLPIFSFLTIWNPTFGQSDLGTAFIVVLPAIIVFLIHPSINRSLHRIFILLLLLVSVILGSNLAGYQKQRLAIRDFIFSSESWTPSSTDDINKVCNQTTLYNTCQAISLAANNQLIGNLESYQSNQSLYLPERQTDFIFASISHYLGILGSFTVVFLFAILFFSLAFYLSLIGYSNPYQFYLVLGGGLTLLTQVIANIGMNLGLFPVVGVPLPWLSYGGSHILGSFLLLFLITYRSNSKFTNIRLDTQR